MPVESSHKVSLLAIAWDHKIQVAKLVKSDLKVLWEWTLDNSAVGVAWLDDQVGPCKLQLSFYFPLKKHT